MKKPLTPFPTIGYFGPEYFCNREEEIQTLVGNVNGGISTIMVAVRRLGKTGLIKHLFNKISDEKICIYTDVLPTENINEMLNSMASSIVNSVPEKSGLGKKVWDLIKSLRPVVTYDPLTGQPNVSFDLKPKESEIQIETLFNFLEKQDKPVVFAIDEFQQILQYPEKNSEAWLRKIMQQLTNVAFVFSGSQQHIMSDMFLNPAKPFYRSAQFLKLDKIPFGRYQEFIISKFAENNKIIEEQVVSEILKWTNVHTYFVQLLCNRVFTNSGKKVTTETWRNEALKLIKEQEYVFFGYREMLTKQQWNLLKAIGSEGRVYAPTSKEIVTKHLLGSPATVLRSLKSLSSKDLIFNAFDEEGKSYYSVCDVLFERWIQNN